MRNKFLPVLLSILLMSMQSMAQEPGKVSGSLSDQKSKALSSVTVTLLNSKDSSLVKADVSDINGKFEIPVIKAGDYLLSYSLVGFEKKYSRSFTVNEGQSVELGAESLTTSAVKLQGVTVTSKKPMIEVKADKTIFNVEASINAHRKQCIGIITKKPGHTGR